MDVLERGLKNGQFWKKMEPTDLIGGPEVGRLDRKEFKFKVIILIRMIIFALFGICNEVLTSSAPPYRAN